MPGHGLEVLKCRLGRGWAAAHGSLSLPPPPPREGRRAAPAPPARLLLRQILRSASQIRPSEHPDAAAGRSLAQVCGLSS